MTFLWIILGFLLVVALVNLGIYCYFTKKWYLVLVMVGLIAVLLTSCAAPEPRVGVWYKDKTCMECTPLGEARPEIINGKRYFMASCQTSSIKGFCTIHPPCNPDGTLCHRNFETMSKHEFELKMAHEPGFKERVDTFDVR